MEVHSSFAFAFVYFSVPGVFFRNRLKELAPRFTVKAGQAYPPRFY